MLEFLKEFIYEVDWSEPWLLALLAFHVVTAIAILLLRRHSYVQAAILALLAVLCLASERINEYAALNSDCSKFSSSQIMGGYILSIDLIGALLSIIVVLIAAHLKFARQQYFDSSGVFISLIFSGPIISNCLLIVFCWFANVWQLLIQVGTLKVQRQQRAKERTRTVSDVKLTPSGSTKAGDKKNR